MGSRRGLSAEPPLVLSLPSCSQKASFLLLTHRRYHFLENLARCGPPGGSFLGQRAKILTRLRRGFGTGPGWENRKDDEKTPLLMGLVYSSFSSAEFSGHTVTLDFSFSAQPLASQYLCTHWSWGSQDGLVPMFTWLTAQNSWKAGRTQVYLS